MQEVAVGNYRAFIAAADALVAIKEEVSSIDKHLESLVITFLLQFSFHIFYVLVLVICCLILKCHLIYGLL